MNITKVSSKFLTVTRGSATFIDAGIDNVIDVTAFQNLIVVLCQRA